MNNFCGNCGSQVTGDTKFCANCGAPVGQPNYNQPQYNQYDVKPNNGSTAGMVLGIIDAAWALLSLVAVGEIQTEIFNLAANSSSVGSLFNSWVNCLCTRASLLIVSTI